MSIFHEFTRVVFIMGLLIRLVYIISGHTFLGAINSNGQAFKRWITVRQGLNWSAKALLDSEVWSPFFSGRIIATSHDRFPPNGGLVREITLFQGNLGW